MHNIKCRCQKLLSQLLGSCKMHILIILVFELVFLLDKKHYLAWVQRCFTLSQLLTCDFIHPLILLLHLIYLCQLLQLVLILHLLTLICILHVLSDQTGLIQQLFSLLQEAFLLEVWYQHACMSSLIEQEFTDGTLNFDCSQMLCCHRSTPRLLNDSLQTQKH